MVGVFAYLKACCFLGLIIHGTHWTNYSTAVGGAVTGQGQVDSGALLPLTL